MDEKFNETIDIESSVVLSLADQYQNINAELANLSAECYKPETPSFLDVEKNIDGIVKTVQKLGEDLAGKMNEITSILNNALEILKDNDEVNMVDFFNSEDLLYLLSGTRNDGEEKVALTLDERRARIENYSNYLYEQLANLKDIYTELYGNGIVYDPKKAYEMIHLFDALGIFSIRDDTHQMEFGFTKDLIFHNASYYSEGYDASAIIALTDFLQENGTMDALRDYLNGKSWDESGMEKLYGDHLRTIDKQEGNLSALISNPTDAEMIFTYRFFSSDSNSTDKFFEHIISPSDYDNMAKEGIVEGGRKETSAQRYSNPNYRTYFTIKDEDKAKAYLKKLLNESDIFQTSEDMLVEAYTCKQLEEDIAIISQEAYKYRFDGRALAYETDKDNPEYDYDKYFLVDYTDYPSADLPKDYEYLSQGEIALYMMYKGNNESRKAADYLKSLSDRITSRKAMENVENAIAYWNENGGDVLDYLDCGLRGFGSGFTSYIEGIFALFGDGLERTQNDYERMYMLALLSEQNKYNANLSPDFRDILKNHYEVMSSVGSSAIPVALSFVPGGRTAGAVLSTLSSAGNKYKYARQNGADVGNAWTYSILSGLSDTAMTYILSGIAKVNGSDEALKSFGGWAMGNVKSFGSGYVGTFVDAGIRSWVLGEDFDLVETNNAALHNAIIASQSTAVLNTASMAVDIAPKILKRVSERLSKILIPSAKADESTTVSGKKMLDEMTRFVDEHQNDARIIDYTDDGTITIETKYGDKIEVPVDMLNSDDNIDNINFLNMLGDFDEKVASNHINDDVWYQAEADAARLYNSQHPDDDFYDLPKWDEYAKEDIKAEDGTILYKKGDLISIGRDTLTKQTKESNMAIYQKNAAAKADIYRKIAENTYKTIREQAENGEFKPGVTINEVMEDTIYQKGANPETFYTDEHNKAYWNRFDIDPETGRAKVYIFQDEGKDSNPFLLNSDYGSFGRPNDEGTTNGGMFAIPAGEYQELYNRYYNPETGSWDIGNLPNDLGGKTFPSGKVMVIEVELPASELSMPNSANKGSFYGEYVPGGQTSGGKTETLVPYFNINEIPEDYNVVLNPETINQTGGDESWAW